MKALVIDNFAGGGGASTGIEAAIGRSVDIAINHDREAVAMHAANHPATRHFCQSIMAIDPLVATGGKPVALAWFSPDCKHHSKAKGGKPREKNIRDLAWVVVHWPERLLKATPGGLGAPQVIMLENVEEFRQWGPLDAEGMPIRERAGEEFNLWTGRLKRLGYKVEWRELRACDYGAPTSRKRLYLIARRDKRPIVWPQPTHGRRGTPDVISGRLLPWRTAAECIDWSIPCPSIFDRRRPLKDATHRRIAHGVMRYVVNAAEPFVIGTAFTTTRASRIWDVEEPLRTTTSQQEFGVVDAAIVPITHSGDPTRVHSTREPTRTITTANGGEFALATATLATAACLDRQFGTSRGASAIEPMPTALAGSVKTAAVSAFLHKYRPNSPGASLDDPAPTVTANSFIKRPGGAPPISVVYAHMEQANTGMVGHDMRESVSTIVGKGCTQRLVETTMIEAGALPPPLMERAVQVAAFLIKYYGTGGQLGAADEPLATATTLARFAVVTVKIDAVTYVIVDIGMRMLTRRELANAQGFPCDYILDPIGPSGKPLTNSASIRMIGNSVCPDMAEALVRANLPELCVSAEPEEVAA